MTKRRRLSNGVYQRETPTDRWLWIAPFDSALRPLTAPLRHSCNAWAELCHTVVTLYPHPSPFVDALTCRQRQTMYPLTPISISPPPKLPHLTKTQQTLVADRLDPKCPEMLCHRSPIQRHLNSFSTLFDCFCPFTKAVPIILPRCLLTPALPVNSPSYHHNTFSFSQNERD